jgi:hypothetical protein
VINHSFGHGKHPFPTYPVSLAISQLSDRYSTVAKVSVAHPLSIFTFSLDHLLRILMVPDLYPDVSVIIDFVHFVLAIEKLGNPGWNWDAHLKYAKKSERYVAFQNSGFSKYLLLLTVWSRFVPPSAQEAETENLHFNPAHHGTDGEQRVIYISIGFG